MSVEKETWENTSRGEVWVLTLDNRGNEKATQIRPGQKVLISPAERQAVQDRAFNDDMDDFKNGRLRPVRLVETAEDYDAIATNPNYLSESDLEEMFDLSATKFKTKIKEISNVLAMTRLLELAESEAYESKVTAAQIKLIKARKDELSPPPKSSTVLGNVSPR